MLAGSKLFVACLSSSYARNRVLLGWGKDPTAGTVSTVLCFSGAEKNQMEGKKNGMNNSERSHEKKTYIHHAKESNTNYFFLVWCFMHLFSSHAL